MPVQSLTDTDIDTTYPGLLHSQGEALPSVGTINMVDGVGNASSLYLGLSGSGIKVTGNTITDSLSGGSVIVQTLSAGLSGVTSPNTPKAWAKYLNNTLSPAFNIASVDSSTTGVFIFYFTNTSIVGDSNYSVNVTVYNNTNTAISAFVDTTLIDNSRFTVKTVNLSGALVAVAGVSVTVNHL